MASTDATTHRRSTDGRSQLPSTVDGRWVSGSSMANWSAILSGAVISFLLFVVVSSLWTALAATNEGGFWSDTIEWWEMGTAIGAAAIGAFTAGWVQPTRGGTPGMITGVTVWGLTLFASLAIGIPSLVGAFADSVAATFDLDALDSGGADSTLEWAVFIAFAGGLVVSAFAGAAGGRARRPLTLDLRDDAPTTERNHATEATEATEATHVRANGPGTDADAERRTDH